VHFLRQAALKQEDYERRANLDAAVTLAETLCAKDVHETKDSCAAAGSESPDRPAIRKALSNDLPATRKSTAKDQR